MATPTARRGGAARPEGEFDVIPMNRPSPVVYVALAVLVLAVVGLLWLGLRGRRQGEQGVEAVRAEVEARASASIAADPRAKREHLEVTRRALAAAETMQAASASPIEDEATPDLAAPAAGGPPPPVVDKAAVDRAASDLDSLGDDIASKLE